MPRAICQSCQRPKTSCICRLFVSIINHIEIVILQHPSEVKQSKGSVTLLKGSLQKCHVLQGESFKGNADYQKLFLQKNHNTVLLYPSDKSELISQLSNKNHQQGAIKRIILLDGTWKKAYRMYMSNPELHSLPHIRLPDNISSLYDARSTKKKGGLSTLEAACHTLSQLEDNDIKYQELLNSFKAFNQQLLAFRPSTL
ncbi:tRNA-uridine aminocarboxypropyltransferase [Thalassotalea sp. 1_MG-2023]|uniref:tRNA-uridine aminocarboxypropyltransferase n=1 Tax=Thalassotalea sp. 1_MG-2023 TaxID=3062680 RepID=UPI0026E1F3BA|nr:tRNA-uridine aminocarboxypropyltransferase [Thalassotalea sp. 1_MG-2023]MDO6428301.1 tRNA-uridine aminocarboxypropyltransferase [Thalassotalea sp. 1_MG-2023]